MKYSAENNKQMQDLISSENGVINLRKFLSGTPVEITLDQETPWIASILEELVSNFSYHEQMEEPPKGTISASLSFYRDSNPSFGDHLVIRGDIKGCYLVPCIRCLEFAPQDIQATFSSCFLNQSMENDPEFEEATEIFCYNEEMELHFYRSNEIDVREVLHEIIYVHADPLPLHDPNCKGLCSTCGINLNENDCHHAEHNVLQ